jgi:hypothetical protein
MAALALACLAVGLGAPAILPRLAAPLAAPARLAPGEAAAALAVASAPLRAVALAGAGLLLLAGLLAAIRRVLLAGRPIGATVTWDCGYARPTARMQYTASSFAQPLTSLFAGLLRGRAARRDPEGYFPREGRLHTETPDAARAWLFDPLFRGVARALERLAWLQAGRVQLYVLYLVLTLLALLLFYLEA